MNMLCKYACNCFAEERVPLHMDTFVRVCLYACARASTKLGNRESEGNLNEELTSEQVHFMGIGYRTVRT